MAVSLYEFFGTRKGAIAAIVIAVIVILAIVAATWTYDPQVYVALGIRHDTTLDSYINALHSTMISLHPSNLTAWSVTWLNNTAARVNLAFTYHGAANETSNQSSTILYKESFVMTDFYGTNLASAFVGSISSTYTLTNTTYTSGAYQLAFGHPPSTFLEYRDTAGQGNFIWQLDQFVQVGSLSRSSCV